jgi:hypothetical protein
MSHRSQGPWRSHGKRAVARVIMQRFQLVDCPSTTEQWQSRHKKYRAVHVHVDGRRVSMTWRRLDAGELVAFHLHMLRFWSRFDSMAAPSMDERVTQAWEWTERT